MKSLKLLCVYMKPEYSDQKRNKDYLFSILRKNFNVDFIRREKLNSNIKGYDLVISLGGDGTFIFASRYIKNRIPLLGVNLDTKRKEGFYASLNTKNFENFVDKIKNKEFLIIPLLRLKAKINNKSILYSLNEYFIGSIKSFYSAKYELIIGKKKEIQKSSGIIVATPSGSYAWYSSMGGIPLQFNENKFVYMTREPYKGKVITCNMCGGKLNADKKVKIRYLLKYKGVLAVDSQKEYSLKEGDLVEITSAKEKLNWAMFK